MAATAMSGWTTAASRARLSILTHNKVLMGDEGALAKRIEDVADIGLDDANPGDLTAGDNDDIVDFMSEISREEQLLVYQFPIMMDPLGMNAFNICSPEDGSVFPSDIANHNQIGSIENWFSTMHAAP